MYKFASLAIIALLSTSQAINVDKKSASQSFYVLVEEPKDAPKRKGTDGDSIIKKEESLTQ